MAFPLPQGITPSEIAFLSEMELVTVVPRQRLEILELLGVSPSGGSTELLQPPVRASVPLWLALLLKRQRRINIVPPFWLHPESLSFILQIETEHRDYSDAFSPPPRLPGQQSVGDRTASDKLKPRRTVDGQPYFPTPPFLPQNIALAPAEATGPGREAPSLPYHWLEVGSMLLEAASDDLVDPNQTRRLLKDLREVRTAKMRKGIDVLDTAAMAGGGVALTGVGAMEIGEMRGLVTGIVENLRYFSGFVLGKIGVSKEQARREQLAEEGNKDYDDTQDYGDSMEL
ncbi:hypothetical protein Egran_02392 [Elaphomyces granulatus]|uniref:DNA replication complex GINS protein PSF2 n=1 Tax=Elaphomyces granulatus TaxID=519963 RepID=A0A232M0L9_9EURO|nr:hypothetical protein Egran_02392 [Elaphomyces granulatus]